MVLGKLRIEYPLRHRVMEWLMLTLVLSDAFAGGFIAGIVKGKSLDESIDMGHWLASLSIKELGPSYANLISLSVNLILVPQSNKRPKKMAFTARQSSIFFIPPRSHIRETTHISPLFG